MQTLGTMTRTLVVLAAAAGSSARLSAQDAAEVRRLFEAGRYAEVVAAVAPEVDPAVLYVAAQSHQRLKALDQALALYDRLSRRGEDDPWRFIALSGRDLLEGDLETSLASARRAVMLSDVLAEAHYQLGLVLAQRMAWRDAAAAFDRASDVAPSHAYAHYYAGLMHSRSGRVDRMAVHFEQFLKLAPEAPERPEVLQTMRTVRGR